MCAPRFTLDMKTHGRTYTLTLTLTLTHTVHSRQNVQSHANSHIHEHNTNTRHIENKTKVSLLEKLPLGNDNNYNGGFAVCSHVALAENSEYTVKSPASVQLRECNKLITD